MDIKISKFNINEKKELVYCIEKSFDKTKKWAEEKILEYSSDSKKIILVALHKNKIVGFIFIDDGDDDKRVSNLVKIENLASIPWMAVLPRYRNQNIGSKLLFEAENYLSVLNKEGFVLDCNEDKTGFYEKSSYKNVGFFIREEDKPPRKQFVMVKNVI